ncbi:sec-independent translocase [Streptomyces polyrhachis]|uniref:Sec-independent translocase n=1 Tax=Streptomyces polyrhachis TaxID=1282885 RepID=A0ABW2GQ45_9ACTN
MVFNLSPFTLVALALIALFVYGPDKLPKAVGEAARTLRRLRTMLSGATESVREELGPEYKDLSLRDLNPRAFIHKHLLEEEKPWVRPEPPFEKGSKPQGWPANVPYPSAASMGMPAGTDALTAPIPRMPTPPMPQTNWRSPEQVKAEQAAAAAAAADTAAADSASADSASADQGDVIPGQGALFDQVPPQAGEQTPDPAAGADPAAAEPVSLSKSGAEHGAPGRDF